MEQESLRRQLGVVPQEGFLFAGTVAENIAFARPDATREEVEQAAAAVGADIWIRELEHGYDTQLGERGFRLSLGPAPADRVRAGAARRSAHPDPRRGDLVGRHRHRARDRARRCSGSSPGRTAFVIAHRLSTIRGADLIVVLAHGQIVEQGTHAELMAQGGAYTGLYGDWAERVA